MNIVTADLAARAEALRALHRPGTPLVLRNAWDAASAKALVADAPALATTSVGRGRSRSATRTAATSPPTRPSPRSRASSPPSTSPVTADCEAGYGLEPDAFVAGLLGAGAVGCNLEDTDHATGALRDPGEQAAFLAAVKEAGRAAGVDLVAQRARRRARARRHARGRPRARPRLPRGGRRLRLSDLLPRGGGHRRLRRGRRSHQRRRAPVRARRSRGWASSASRARASAAACSTWR